MWPCHLQGHLRQADRGLGGYELQLSVQPAAIRFSSELTLSTGSICLRNGYLFIYNEAKDVEFLTGENELKVLFPVMSEQNPATLARLTNIHSPISSIPKGSIIAFAPTAARRLENGQ